jgi:hypothetical protein
MPQLFDLPRELRDLIYMAVITWERPQPTLEDTSSSWGYYQIGRTQGYGTGCDFSREKPPSTCANVLAVSRQFNQEMRQSIDCARRRGLLVARMDCIANGNHHHFTWLSIPIVHSKPPVKSPDVVAGWAPKVPVVGKLLAACQRKKDIDYATTSIEQLQINIRLLEKDGEQYGIPLEPTTSWYVCAALKRICEHRLELLPTPSWPPSVAIETLVLNIVPPDRSAKDTRGRRDSANSKPSHPEDDMDIAHIVARELVDVWNKLWSGHEFKGRLYGKLLERIERVRVCVDGVLIRERDLKLELERGQAERKRIAQRVGW